MGVGTELKVEETVDIGRRYNIKAWAGTADIILFNPNTDAIVIADYKDGQNVIYPDAPQLLEYLMGACNPWPVQRFKQRRTVIIQPRDARDPVKVYDWSLDEYKVKCEARIAVAVANDDPKAPLIAGTHCKYCNANPGCPQLVTQSMTVVEQAFANVPTPGAPGSVPVVDNTIPDERLTQILDAAPMVREWLNEIEIEALRRFQSGRALPGYKVIHGRSTRKWAMDEVDLLAKFHSMGIPQKDSMKTVIRTPKQIESLARVKDWSDRKKTSLAKMTTKPEGALKVVPSSTKGAPVLFDANALFADVPPPSRTSATAPKTLSFL